MNALGDYILSHPDDYAVKVITADRHPWNHCSFGRNGGEWPEHCIADSVGAAVWPKVLSAACSTSGKTSVMHKGENPEKEEYSIFSKPGNSDEIVEIVRKHNISDIDICGLAGDICVLSTLRDALKVLPGVRFHVLKEFAPSLDGGKALNNFMKENEICDR